MLNADIKRQIDSARNILVGKVPDPKAQVEQITTALIYKFMDDMDRENIEVGLQPQFFIKEYKEFAWSKLMDSKMSGQSRLDLYVQAIAKMPQNPYIPQLFRDIFKGAFLPFRDARTLNLFLKEINNFQYDHSENLGNAFEYLLSILGSQGDAGQFRTPRHIIDFIVSIIEPKKNESILDPACGTAGFLISSFKHILKTNSSETINGNGVFEQGETATETIIADKKVYTGDLLSPDEKIKLTKNINGYDISPDMVKLALVNLYLHGFKEPQIYEYDTLSDEKRWDEDYDVILANPPFMTPKGGISPHKRFSVQARRSEVLFVDYIAEHLKIGGRAGIIVPEGIIFQTSNAYVNLRKNLIENWGLWAVISLPSGVFQPYSGVKTSVLILDKTLSKDYDDILFIKIENDGFDLGAQRRKIEKNDLPAALNVVREWKYNRSLAHEDNQDLSLVVSKNRIAENGDYNLTGDRYKEVFDYSKVTCPVIGLNSLIKERALRVKDKDIPVWSVSNIHGFVRTEDLFQKKVSSKNLNNYKIIMPNYFAYNPSRINVGSIAYNNTENIGCVSPMYVVFEIINDKLNAEYLFQILKSKEADKIINQKSQGAVRKQLRYKDLISIKIPLPVKEIQDSIVKEIKQYQKVIKGAKQIIENWEPKYRIDSKWEVVELGEICSYEGGTQPPKSTFIYKPQKGYIRLLQIRDYRSDDNAVYIPVSERHKTCNDKDIMIGRYGPPVFQILRGKSGAYNVALMKCIPNSKRITNDWLYYFLSSSPIQEKIISLSVRVRQAGVRPDDLNVLKIPLPPIDIQKKIIKEIEEEKKIVDACNELIEKMIDRIEQLISDLWGDN